MKSSLFRLLPILFAGMFLFAGCASQEVVKKDEPIVPTASKQAVIAPATPSKSPEKPTASTSLSGSEQKKSQQSNVQVVSTDLQKSLEKVYFNFDSSNLNDAARQTLTKNFAVLKQNPNSKIRVEGHCDERGSAEYNLALGERRAKAAVSYLTTMGAPSSQLSIISYGKEKPADPGHDEAAWAKNRRDEFVLAK